LRRWPVAQRSSDPTYPASLR